MRRPAFVLLWPPTTGACECEVLGREELDSAGQLDRWYRSPLLWRCAKARCQGQRKWPQLGQHAAGGGCTRTDARRSQRGYGVWAWIGAIGRHPRTLQEQCEDSDDGRGRAEKTWSGGICRYGMQAKLPFTAVPKVCRGNATGAGGRMAFQEVCTRRQYRRGYCERIL